MIMSSKIADIRDMLSGTFASFQYPQMLPQATQPSANHRAESAEPRISFTEAEFAERVAAERAAAVAETEQKLREDYERRVQRETTKISAAIVAFEDTRKDYFSRVEAEVVQLSIAIAAKIIHRAAQVDPMLVAALVQIALGQLREGAAASIRIRPEEAQRWRDHFSALSLKHAVTIVEDGTLETSDCFLETELGSVNFNVDAQLKEVQQGFFDVLAQKPQM
jgi:flagellar assembly protein FliH